MPAASAPAVSSARFRRRAFVLALALLALAMAPAAARADAVTVREPAYGLPHIYADTDLELARENGRVIAQDRLGQIILLARVGRGTLSQAFLALDPSTLDDDIETRRTGYTSSELNRMFEALPSDARNLVLEYCKGVNDTIEAIYAGQRPEPFEVNLLRNALSLGDDLFGNKTNVSDQVDPNYAAPGGEWPTAGFQFTPELAMAIGVLEVRNFGLDGFSEDLFAELQELIALHGPSDGQAIWDDRNFANDPLAPVSVPDSTTPGFGGPLAAFRAASPARLAKRYPAFDFAGAVARREERQAGRAERASKLGAWPKLGSYAWVIGPGRSATGNPWLGGFPQTGTLTPSIMHYVENRSAEPGGIRGNGMEFVGAPIVLIGHTDRVAWTTTTAQLPVVDTFFEELVNEDADALRYLDEGTPAALSQRTELFPALGPPTSRVFWRSHARNGDGGSRPIVDFLGDAAGTATSGSTTQLKDTGAFAGGGLAGGHVAIVDGAGAGQIRAIASVPDGDTLEVTTPFTTAPASGSEYVAVGPGSSIVAVAIDSAAWMEESTTVLGFSQYQKAESLLDVRAGARLIPTTHNFLAADNHDWNGIGSDAGAGNIGFWSTGFSRVRQDGTDVRLPLDGTAANPLVLLSGTIDAATASTLTAAGDFAGQDLAPPAFNARYDDPSLLAGEYIVTIRSAAGHKQTRRIAANDDDELTLESELGVVPAPGDTFEVQEVIVMPEAVNPSEGYTANWNNKAATADPGDAFGRNHRVAFILERLASDTLWDRAKQRQLNENVAGLDGRGRFGRYLVPRLREAVDAVGNGGSAAVDTTLARLEQWNAAPELGRNFVDPVLATTVAGEVAFLKNVISELGRAIYGDEFDDLDVPGGSHGEALVVHAIDSAAADVPGARAQSYSGDYFNGADWRVVVRDALAEVAAGGIPADAPRPNTTYNHPLAALASELSFPPTPAGNRGTYEQIVEVGDTVRGEFIFPLGQSAHIEGTIAGGVTFIDPHNMTLHPIWRDWRFIPMLSVSEDLASDSAGDTDGDGVLDGFERYYYGGLLRDADSDEDADGLDLLDEFLAGSDPTDDDTDDDGDFDGIDPSPQDRLVAVPEPGAVLQALAALVALRGLARWRRGAPALA
ncbi:MAG TPA: penicillin acylase family protein [Myxococcota bacterium]|nr:penicillin acylase family protein [Myxococcota bacterium]